MLLAKLLATSTAAHNSHNTSCCSSSSSSGGAVLDWRAVKMLREIEAALLVFADAEQQPTAAAQQLQAQLEWAVQQLLPHDTYNMQQVINNCGTLANFAAEVSIYLRNAALASQQYVWCAQL
jgi:hypothetical protein